MPESLDLDSTFSFIAKGNAYAEQFCRKFYNFVHTLDDLIDRDKPVDGAQAALVMLGTLSEFACNPFFQEHRAAILPVIHISTTAFIASNEKLASLDLRDRLIGEVLKSQYQDVFLLVAFLTGGIDHQLDCDRRFRSYCFG